MYQIWHIGDLALIHKTMSDIREEFLNRRALESKEPKVNNDEKYVMIKWNKMKAERHQNRINRYDMHKKIMLANILI